MNLNELRARRAAALKKARDLVDRAESRGEDLDADEQRQYDEHWKAAEDLRSRIDRGEKLEREEAELRKSQHDPIKPAIEDEKRGNASNNPRSAPEYRKAFDAYLRSGSPAELRALQADIDTAGGYLVPTDFSTQLIKAIDNNTFVRGLSNVLTLTRGDSIGIPSLDADPDDADWTSEVGTGNEDSAMAFGGREMTPHPLAKRLRISNKLLRTSAIDVEQLAISRLGYKFGVTQEKGFLTGSGSGQPLGVFTASALGISTGRDVSTDNTTTAPTLDGLKNAKFTLKGGYWGRAGWIFHRDVVKVIAKIKDGDGRYIWEDSVRAGEPDQLLGFPVRMSEYAPNTLTTGLYVGILGDFKAGYWIADSLAMSVQRLVELYAETNRVGFIGRLEVDGAPVLEEAFVRVKLA